MRAEISPRQSLGLGLGEALRGGRYAVNTSSLTQPLGEWGIHCQISATLAKTEQTASVGLIMTPGVANVDSP